MDVADDPVVWLGRLADGDCMAVGIITPVIIQVNAPELTIYVFDDIRSGAQLHDVALIHLYAFFVVKPSKLANRLFIDIVSGNPNLRLDTIVHNSLDMGNVTKYPIVTILLFRSKLNFSHN